MSRSGRWFRFYDAVLDDPKVQRLTPEQFRFWVNLLCLASRYDGQLPKPEEAAFSLRMTPEQYGPMLRELVQLGLFDRCGATWEPHNWAFRQFKSDVSNDRVRRYRERKRNADCNVTVTPSETDTETEADTEQKVEESGAAAPTPTKRGTRLPEDWAVSESGRAFATSNGLDADKVAEAFCDYWRAATGATSRKLDWDAAFRTWCRRQAENRRPAPAGSVPAESWNERRIRLAREAVRQ